jgi:hypothetical protein
MPNAIVRAAATGLPSLSRRLFLGRASAISVAAAIPAAAVAKAPDPIFAAVEDALAAEDRFNRTIELLSAAHRAVLAHGFGYKPTLEILGTVARSRDEVRRLYNLERFRFPTAAATIDAAERRSLAAFDHRATLIASTRKEHDADALELAEKVDGKASIEAEVAALSTVPVTLAGITALATYMSLRHVSEGDNLAIGARSLAMACRNLLPRQS